VRIVALHAKMLAVRQFADITELDKQELRLSQLSIYLDGLSAMVRRLVVVQSE
jgi:hypothetical protein